MCHQVNGKSTVEYQVPSKSGIPQYALDRKNRSVALPSRNMPKPENRAHFCAPFTYPGRCGKGCQEESAETGIAQASMSTIVVRNRLKRSTTAATQPAMTIGNTHRASIEVMRCCLTD